MLQNLQHLSRPQRQVIFVLIFGGGLMALIALTVLLIASALNSGRSEAVAAIPQVTVRPFAALPDDDAYPAAVAAWQDGVYTGSYANGAIWFIGADGNVRELEGAREAIGAVAGLTVGPDGSLYVVDQLDTDVRSGGGNVKRVAAEGTITTIAEIDDERCFVTPDDVTLDPDGYIYVSDRGRNEVWRFDGDGGNGALWWVPPADSAGRRTAVTGLAYDPMRDAIIVTEPETNVIFAVSITDFSSEVLYTYPTTNTTPPGFDGVTVTPDGVIYVAALGQNAVMKLDNGELQVLARGFRGASDVDLSADNRLYVANWDQAALGMPLVRPRLPFAIDVIEFEG